MPYAPAASIVLNGCLKTGVSSRGIDDGNFACSKKPARRLGTADAGADRGAPGRARAGRRRPGSHRRPGVLPGVVAGATTATDRLYANADGTRTLDRSAATPADTFSGFKLDWAYVASAFPSTTYWNTADDARVGTSDGGASRYRSFFRMPLPSLAGAQIVHASLTDLETWSWSCQAEPVELWQTGAIAATTNWLNQPAWQKKVATVTAAHGYSASCPSAPVGFDVTGAVSDALATGGTDLTLGLRATSETSSLYWKRFSNNPTISITYDVV
jgi:hypothetical protein